MIKHDNPLKTHNQSYSTKGLHRPKNEMQNSSSWKAGTSASSHSPLRKSDNGWLQCRRTRAPRNSAKTTIRGIRARICGPVQPVIVIYRMKFMWSAPDARDTINVLNAFLLGPNHSCTWGHIPLFYWNQWYSQFSKRDGLPNKKYCFWMRFRRAVLVIGTKLLICWRQKVHWNVNATTWKHF